jgi:carboxylesterase type B
MQTKTGRSKVYLYFFSRVPPGPAAARMGAYHSSEIAYVFHNTHPARTAMGRSGPPALRDDVQVLG